MLLLWMGCSAAGLYYFFASHYGVFDPTGQWQQQPWPELDIRQLQLGPVAATEWHGVLIADENCSCSSFAREHSKRLAEQQPNLQIIELPLSQAQQQLTLMATPVFLLFRQQRLVYAGPLATDLLCSEQQSLISSLLTPEQRLPGLWLNGESSACRCLLSET
ncbi:DUF6436 domain-containing protein [Rheinheimera sp.]|uniref:DUF6436 domain-containing protein n=1 Tax=Rheinheimera sp. TaxID=1869214 RepID=UPI00307E32E3